MENSDHGRSMRRLKRKPDGFTSLEINDMVFEGQTLGVHEIEDNDYVRLARVVKRKDDDFTGLQLSAFGQMLGVHEIEENDDERFISPLKTKHDDFTGIQLSNIGFHKLEDDDYEDNEDDNDIDPQYKLFLKKTRVDGKFYALEVGKSNGVPIYLKYHVEGDSDDEDREPPTRRRRKRSNGQKEVKVQVQARKDNRKKMGSPRNMRSVERRDLVECDEDSEIPTRRKTSNGKKEVKTQIQAKKDNRKKMESRRNLKSVQERERRDLVEYNVGMELPTRRKISNGKKEEKTQRQARKDNRKKMGSPRNLRSVQGRERSDPVEYDEDLKLPTGRRISNGKNEVKTQVQVRTYNKRKMENPRNLSSVQRNPVEFDEDDLSVDGCYQLFLNDTIFKEGKFIFTSSSGTRVVYGDDEAGSSDSEIEVWDLAPYCSKGNPSPFVSQRRHHASGISEFRKKLMSILQRPFNQEEYEKLLLDIEEQKAAGHIKDLRSRPISFSVAGLTKSLLDYHRDVEREIHAARHNQPKVLNILRGFFYWLENLVKEGEFKPWLDASCRAVLPAPQ